MNTIIDLNTVNTITYNDQASYAIVFGTNLGNTTQTIDSFASSNIAGQCSLTSITSPVRDLLVDLAFDQADAVILTYVGTYGNISLQQIAPATWRVSGIRSVAQYNEAFANVRYTDQSGAVANTNPEYSYTTTVNDQSGNTRTWTTGVNLLGVPSLAVGGIQTYNEDTYTPITVVQVEVDPDNTQTFRLYANIANASYGSMTDGIVTGNSVSIDGNVISLNTQLDDQIIKYWPASDFVSNVANAITFNLYKSGNLLSTANVDLQIGSQDTDFSLTTSYGFAEDVPTRMIFAITDQDSHPDVSWVSTFAQTSGPAWKFYIDGVALAANTPAVLANTKSNINVANVSFLTYPDSTANVGLTYSQVKILPTGNVVQAANIPITLTNTSSHSDYSLTTSYNIAENGAVAIASGITDLGVDYDYYTVTINQTSPSMSTYPGRFRMNEYLSGFENPMNPYDPFANLTTSAGSPGANLVFSSTNKLDFNQGVFGASGPFGYAAPLDYTGNITLQFSQTKYIGNVAFPQAANVPITITMTSNVSPYTGTMPSSVTRARNNTPSNGLDITTFSIDDGPGPLYPNGSLWYDRQYEVKWEMCDSGGTPTDSTLAGRISAPSGTPWSNVPGLSSLTARRLRGSRDTVNTALAANTAFCYHPTSGAAGTGYIKTTLTRTDDSTVFVTWITEITWT